MIELVDAVERVYQQFAGYACPWDLWVCEQCGPEWSTEDIRATPLRALSLPQLVAIHVMSLDDDGLRHFFPRLMELMLHTRSPVFDFRLADLKDRLRDWQPRETGGRFGSLPRPCGPNFWSVIRPRWVTSPIARRRSIYSTGVIYR